MEYASSNQNWDDSPPAYSGRGYQKLTHDEHQMYPRHPPPSTYAPGPAAMPLGPPAPQHTSFSNNNTNVVVVSQPSASSNTVVVERVRPNDNLIWAVCLMVFCCLTGNLIAFICLIPACVFSLNSGCASDDGDYDSARNYAKASCVCSLCSVTIYLIGLVIGGVVAALYFTVGFAFIASSI